MFWFVKRTFDQGCVVLDRTSMKYTSNFASQAAKNHAIAVFFMQTMSHKVRIQVVSPPSRFAPSRFAPKSIRPKSFRPQVDSPQVASPPSRFAPSRFAPQTDSPQVVSPPTFILRFRRRYSLNIVLSADYSRLF